MFFGRAALRLSALATLAASGLVSGCIVSTAVGLAADVVETAVEVPIAVGGAAVSAVAAASRPDAEDAHDDRKSAHRGTPAPATAAAAPDDPAVTRAAASEP